MSDQVGQFVENLAASAEEIRNLYLETEAPWIIGYSGGKDSTAVLQLVWRALAELPEEHRQKSVHVISTDTLVENPIVASWVAASLDRINAAAEVDGVPIRAHRLTPTVRDSFWVNLIGKGYPAPRHKFRWCTERLKINPSNRFIRDMVQANGEAILLLGTRAAESATRAANLKKHAEGQARDRLVPNAKLPGTLIYTPIEAWSNDEVWMYLMQHENPWGVDNKELLAMYAGATEDGECPLVVDTSTPSCGDSRFGCWVCTLVEQDKSMAAMVRNDTEKDWMRPLLALRNELDYRRMGERGDRHLRDYRRLSGRIDIMRDGRTVPGPYKQAARETWLRKLLEAQTWIREHGPEEMRNLSLIRLDELQEIRRIWVVEKHEQEDRLPAIYEKCLGESYPGPPLDDLTVLGQADLRELEAVCDERGLSYELLRDLLGEEQRSLQYARRAGIAARLTRVFERNAFADEGSAVDAARRRAEALRTAREAPVADLAQALDEQLEDL